MCLSKNPYIIIAGTASPYHCPKCHSTKCPDFISFNESIEMEKNLNVNKDFDFQN